jgi:hypothetical protein
VYIFKEESELILLNNSITQVHWKTQLNQSFVSYAFHIHYYILETILKDLGIYNSYILKILKNIYLFMMILKNVLSLIVLSHTRFLWLYGKETLMEETESFSIN